MSIQLHAKIIGMKFATRLAYRFDFLLAFISFFLHPLIGPVFISAIYAVGGGFGGWTYAQMLVLQGTIALVRGFSFMSFFGILWKTSELVKKGTFDILLLRPVNTLWLLIMESFDEEDIAQLTSGLAIIGVGLWLAHPAGNILLALPLLFMGVLFFFGLALICSGITLIWIETHRLYEFVDLIGIIGSYPKTTFGKIGGTIFATALPIFIAGYYPASALLGFPLDGLLGAIISTVIFVIITLIFWHYALSKRQSAGG